MKVATAFLPSGGGHGKYIYNNAELFGKNFDKKKATKIRATEIKATNIRATEFPQITASSMELVLCLLNDLNFWRRRQCITDHILCNTICPSLRSFPPPPLFSSNSQTKGWSCHLSLESDVLCNKRWPCRPTRIFREYTHRKKSVLYSWSFATMIHRVHVWRHLPVACLGFVL